MSRVFAGVLLSAALGWAVWELRDATISEHTRQPPDSTVTVLMEASARGSEHGQTLLEMTEAQLLGCRLEVLTDPLGPVTELEPGRFEVVLQPALDESDRKQFRGCMEDWNLDHFRLDVVSMVPEPFDD